MDAFNNVLDTILKIFESLKAFFAELMDMFKKDDAEGEGEPA